MLGDTQKELGFRETLTGIVGWECSCLWEIAIQRIPTSSLIEEIHGISSMGLYCVGFKTSPALLNWAAIKTMSTDIIYIGLQLGIWYSGLRQTPRCLLWLWRRWINWRLGYCRGSGGRGGRRWWRGGRRWRRGGRRGRGLKQNKSS